MSDREARDLMSVDSFSQLPFIRPPPKLSSATSGIRLFGIEVPHHPTNAEDNTSTRTSTTATTSTSTSTTATTIPANGGGETARKFECHYCCRQFPTSQALGGHQNAHKRERQHAKRAHLHSAALAAAHHNQAAIYGHHVYGLFDYHRRRLGPLPPAAARFSVEPSSVPHYTSWHATSTANGSIGDGACFYSGLGSVTQPINGSPLPGLWSVPGVLHGGARVGLIHGDSPRMPLPELRGDYEPRFIGVGGGASFSGSHPGTTSSSSASPKDQFVQQLMPSAKENVSLDLHL